MILIYRIKNKYILAIKFYTETKNEEQIKLAYKELESFLETYYNFKWYVKFDLNHLSECYQKNIMEK